MQHKTHGNLSAAVTIVVIAHVVTFIWHLFIVAETPPGLPAPQVLFIAAVVNITPVIGLILLWLQVDRPAAVLVVLPMAVVLVIGVYEHFVNAGPGNVFSLPASEWALSFRASAILLVVLELFGCGLGARMWSPQMHEPTR
jgi:hypothetical protein